MISNEGLQVALSPVQLAAVISDSTVTEGETWSNRLMGAGFGGESSNFLGLGLCAMHLTQHC